MYTVQLLNISTIIDQKNDFINWFNDVGFVVTLYQVMRTCCILTVICKCLFFPLFFILSKVKKDIFHI